MILCRCVPGDAVPLIRGSGVFHGNGDGSNGAISSKFLFRLDFKAFRFLGTTNKLFFSCVLCQNRCEMVSQGSTNEKDYCSGHAKETGKEVRKRGKAKGLGKNVC